MIPCYVCGKEIGGGWCIGFPPAPDNQKMGLCREHDIASHRLRVQRAWQDLMRKNLEENTKKTAYRAGDIPQLLSIYFTGGGAISVPCSSFSVVEGKTLKVITPGGENIFFPLGQVRNYALSPLAHEENAPRDARVKQAQLEEEARQRSTPLPECEPKVLLPEPEPEPEPEDDPDEEIELQENEKSEQNEGGE